MGPSPEANGVFSAGAQNANEEKGGSYTSAVRAYYTVTCSSLVNAQEQGKSER